jgi:arylsulfatase A-like enzyme
VHLFCYLTNLDSRFILPYRIAADITTQSLDQINRFGQDPFFLFINYMDAHDPYCPPAPYDGYFLSAAWTQLHKLQQLVLHYAGWLPRPSWYRYMLTQYSGGIAYLDDEIGRLLEQLRRKGLYDSSLIIITSDHGELFDEHGFRGHMVPMYEGVMRIPLLIKFPFNQNQGTSEGLTMLSDVYATTLSACGMPMPATVAAQPLGNRTRAVGEFENYTIGIHRALYEGAYKYMHYERQQPPELYDLARDPLEKNNLAAALPDVALAMHEKLRAWEVAFPPQYRDSSNEAGAVSGQVLENLKALGYIK